MAPSERVVWYMADWKERVRWAEEAQTLDSDGNLVAGLRTLEDDYSEESYP